MRTKKMFLTVVVLLLSTLSMSLHAQEALNALVKKCESMDKVDMSVVYDKNRKTKKTEKIIKSLTFSNNPQLLNEFLAAFAKDKEAAYKVIEEKKNGRIMPSFYRFSDGKNDVSYSLSVSEDGKVDVSVIERFDTEERGG